MNYCRRCGERLTATTAFSFTCTNEHSLYLNPAPTVGVFLFDTEDNLLLSVRGIEPFKGSLDSFGGFVDGTESIEEALARELREELQLEPGDYTEPKYLTSATSTYEYNGESVFVLSSVFTARLTGSATPLPQDDVAQIHVSKIEDVSIDDIGNEDIKQSFKALLRSRGFEA